MVDLPAGTVTFLYTDIEGSTARWEQQPAAMKAAVAQHDALIHQAIERHGGHVFRTVGDGLCAAFATAPAAVAAALAAQRALQAEPWGEAGPLRVRMALHTGAVEVHTGDYVGACLNRIGRLLAAGHGGQILLSQATADLTRDALPSGAGLRDLGEHRLRDLVRPERVYQLLHPDLPADFPPPRTLEAYPHNLPLQLTSFVGRERELAEVRRLLTMTRLLTLTGTGGCGKTRLALHVAADVIDEYPDGVWLVELAPLADPDLVPQTVATALGMREQPGQPLLTTLLSALKPKCLLLLLDNCEHLIDASARLADALLHGCPGLRVLATSREALGIAGELAWRVPSLALPDPLHLPPVEEVVRVEAVRLFAERAAFVQPGFAVSAQTAPAIAQICVQLDGIPLALELAAARVRALPVEQIARRLDDRFRLLTGGSRTALPRQQTLRAAIDWSYALLTEAERGVLHRLSVFAGGCALEAAEAVGAGEAIEAGDVLELLSHLVDKSLVLVEEQGEEARYRLLETVRQYAAARLAAAGEETVARARHVAWCLALAEQAEPAVWGTGDQRAWVERLETESSNVQAALDWCLEHDPAAGLALAGRLWQLWRVRGHYAEGRRWLEGLVARVDEPGAGRVKALLGAGILARDQFDLPAARAHLEAALALARALGEAPLVAWALRDLGHLRIYLGDLAGARAALEEGLAVVQRTGDRRGWGATLLGLGTLHGVEGDDGRARAFLEEALGMLRQVNDRWLLYGALSQLADQALHAGDAARARRLLEEGLAVARDLGSPTLLSPLYRRLGWVALWQGDAERATVLFEAGLAQARQVEASEDIAANLAGLGSAVQVQGDAGRAVGLLAESLARYRAADNTMGVVDVLPALATACLASGDLARAAAAAREGLALSRDVGRRPTVAAGLDQLGALALAREQPERAARLRGAASAAREEHGVVLPPLEQAHVQEMTAAVRARLGEAAFAAAWAAGQALTLDEAVAEALANQDAG